MYGPVYGPVYGSVSDRYLSEGVWPDDLRSSYEGNANTTKRARAKDKSGSAFRTAMTLIEGKPEATWAEARGEIYGPYTVRIRSIYGPYTVRISEGEDLFG